MGEEPISESPSSPRSSPQRGRQALKRKRRRQRQRENKRRRTTTSSSSSASSLSEEDSTDHREIDDLDEDLRRRTREDSPMSRQSQLSVKKSSQFATASEEVPPPPKPVIRAARARTRLRDDILALFENSARGMFWTAAERKAFLEAMPLPASVYALSPNVDEEISQERGTVGRINDTQMCTDLEGGYRMADCIVDIWVLPAVCLVGLTLNIACLLVFSANRYIFSFLALETRIVDLRYTNLMKLVAALSVTGRCSIKKLVFTGWMHPLVPALFLLSCCDLLQLFLSLFVLFLPAYIDFNQVHIFSWLGQISYLSTGLLSPILLASNCASIWTITFISIERHRLPPLVLIALLALLFNTSKWAEYRWEWLVLDGSEEVGRVTGNFIIHNPANISHNFLVVRDRVLYPLLVYLIPLCLLTCLNFRILFFSLSRLECSHSSRTAQEKRTISLLISIVLLFFLCHTGGLVIRFVKVNEWTDSFVFYKDSINLLFNLNSMANPMLYFFFTRQFRDLRERYISSHFSSQSTGIGRSVLPLYTQPMQRYSPDRRMLYAVIEDSSFFSVDKMSQ